MERQKEGQVLAEAVRACAAAGSKNAARWLHGKETLHGKEEKSMRQLCKVMRQGKDALAGAACSSACARQEGQHVPGWFFIVPCIPSSTRKHYVLGKNVTRLRK